MLLHLFGCLLFESAQIDLDINNDDTSVVGIDTAQDTGVDTDIEDTDTGIDTDDIDTDTDTDTEDTDTEDTDTEDTDTDTDTDTDVECIPSTELCDGIDNDCDGTLPSDELDNDGDGFVECTIDANGWLGDAVSGGNDCDDTDESMYPNAPELCDGQVNTCGGTLPTNETDDDGDGFVECNIDSSGWDGDSTVVGGNDCDDTDANTFPNTTWYADTDNDGFGDARNPITTCTQPAGYLSDNTDCDDTDATVSPNAPELCDGQLNTCGGTLPSNEVDGDGDGYVTCTIDANGWDGLGNLQGDDCDDTDANEFPGQAWYADWDSDGFGDPNNVQIHCSQLYATTLDNTDCDDTDETVLPNASELCDGQINACGGTLPSDEVDGDGDGYVTCTIDPNGWDGLGNLQGDDCDDTDANEFPGQAWHPDTDNDGFGDAGSSVTACLQPTGSILDNTDCDDSDDSTYPNAPELCDGQVNTCGGTLPLNETDDDGDGYVECNIDSSGWDGNSLVVGGNDCDDTDANTLPNTTWYADSDSDGFGDAGNTVTACFQPAGYLSDNTDCDDGDGSSYPNAPEITADGIDQDCDGQDLTQIGMVDVAEGDLLITEVMYRAYWGENDDWFEVYNASNADIDLLGLEVYTNNGNFVVVNSAILPAGEYVVFVESLNSSVNGNFPTGGIYTIETGLLLNELGDLLSLEYAGTSLGVVDLLDYRASGIGLGVSWVLSEYDAPQEDPANWCFSESLAYVQNNNDAYYGTPGFPNDSCDQDGDGSFYWDCDDSDPTLNILDSDGDGFSSCDGDCDDTDENLSPIDQDGDGLSTCDGDCNDFDQAIGVEDQDGDGFSNCTTDCNDSDAGIYPGQLEVMNDGIDQDCDGTDLIGLTADMLVAGELRLTEIQHHTDRRNEKWYEFYNATGQTVDLFGVSLEANNGVYTIQEHLFMEPSDYFVAGRNADPNQNGGVIVDIETGQNLGREEDWISIFYDDGQVFNILSEIQYLEDDNWENYEGRSKVVYDPAAFPNDNLDFWCISTSVYSGSSGLYGTPGEANDSCDYDFDGQFLEDCDNEDATIFTGAGYLDDPQVCMEDGDGDGWGSPNAPGAAVDGTDCDDNYAEMNNDDLDGDGLTTCAGDCDDNDNNIGIIDSDSDGQSGCGTPWSIDCDDNDQFTYAGAAYNQSGTACRTDADGDGYGDNNPASGVTAGNDCDDNNPNRHPGKAESANGIDDDCDGIIDEGTVAYDDDGDGFTENQGDCKDNNASAYPGAAPNDSTTACMEDADGDGFGDLSPPAGVTAGTDCKDTNALAYPGAAYQESSNDCMADNDGDGFGNSTPSAGVTPGMDCDDYNALVNPGELESANGVDDDCDGLIDETGTTNGMEPAR